MIVDRTANIALYILIASVAAFGQTRSDRTVPGLQTPSVSTVLRTYTEGGIVPIRRAQTRSELPGLEMVTETTEVLGPDGELIPSEEFTTETIRIAPDTVQVKRDAFAFDSDGRRILVETTQSEQQTTPDGTSTVVQNTFRPDLNGHLGLKSREIQETKSIAPNVTQTDAIVFLPGINEPLRESERTQIVERQVSPNLLQIDSNQSVRDANGRWLQTETRNQVRSTGTSEVLDEESVQRIGNADGKLALSERNVTRRSSVNGQDEVVIETYSKKDAGFVGFGNQLELNQRIRRTTTASVDGGSQTVEEVEARNPVALNEAMQVVQRTVETVRRVGPDQFESERQTFVRDGNGRLILAISERGTAAGR